jgi:hypothetical protein
MVGRLLVVLGLALVCSVGAQATASASRVGCAQRGEESAPITFNDPHFTGRSDRVVLGPLELRGVHYFASPRVFGGLPKRNGYYPAKVALVVLARRSLELTVGGTARKPVLLAFGPKPTPTLIVTSCAANTRASSRPGVVGSGTLFTGTFNVPVAECVTLTITNRVTGRVWRTRLPFGHRCSA